MTENSINAKDEALELHESSLEELDAVSGGRVIYDDAKRISEAMKVFAQLLASA